MRLRLNADAGRARPPPLTSFSVTTRATDQPSPAAFARSAASREANVSSPRRSDMRRYRSALVWCPVLVML